MLVMGEEKNYNVENPNCGNALRGRVGQSITIVASGSRDDATIQLVGNAPAQAHNSPPQGAPPQSQGHTPAQHTNAPAPSQSQHAQQPFKPFGATVGMAINCACANLTARGEFLDPHEVTQIASDLLRCARWLEDGNLLAKSERVPR
jgi:hypothetical protein